MGRRTKKRLALLLVVILLFFLEVTLAINVIFQFSWFGRIFFTFCWTIIIFIIGVLSWAVILGYFWIMGYDYPVKLKLITIVAALLTVLAGIGILPLAVGVILNALLWVLLFLKFNVELIFNSKGDWGK